MQLPGLAYIRLPLAGAMVTTPSGSNFANNTAKLRNAIAAPRLVLRCNTPSGDSSTESRHRCGSVSDGPSSRRRNSLPWRQA